MSHSLFRHVAKSPRAGTCRGCGAGIEKGEEFQKGYGMPPHLKWKKAPRFAYKLCVQCTCPPSPALSSEEIVSLKEAITVSVLASREPLEPLVPAAVPAFPIVDTVPAAKPYGFYGQEDSDGNRFTQRHPFSNFSKMDLKIPGVTDSIGAFKCSEALIMLIKAISSGDGQVAFILTRSAVAGSQSKALGRMVRGFNKAKWTKKTPKVARYVARLKYSQCPKFKERVLAVRGRPVYECSKTDAVWGTGTALGEPIGTGTNYLGAAITQLLSNKMQRSI